MKLDPAALVIGIEPLVAVEKGLASVLLGLVVVEVSAVELAGHKSLKPIEPLPDLKKSFDQKRRLLRSSASPTAVPPFPKMTCWIVGRRTTVGNYKEMQME